MRIVAAKREHLRPWAEMRITLWPWDEVEDHAEQAEELYLAQNPDRAAFIALDAAGSAIGFAEAALRRDYFEGCDTSPVTFLEGIFVRTDARLKGTARLLVESVADWGRERGCSEFASNVLIDNAESLRFHAAIGFAETERVVYFRKGL